MKEIKAFVPASRAADVLEALKEADEAGAGILNLAAFSVQRIGRGSERDAHYSIELAEATAPQVKVEILCEAAEVARFLELIKAGIGEGANDRGWIVVTPVLSAEPLDEA